MSSVLALQACSGECFEAILNFLPFPALAQLIAARHDVEWQRSLDDRLQLRHLRGYSVEKIAPGGAIHLRPETLESWFNLFGSRDTRFKGMLEIQQRLLEYIWWVDLITCNGYMGAVLHGGCVNRVSCPHCRSLWSGIASASLWVEHEPIPEDGSVGHSLFNSESNEPRILANPHIRLSLNVHIREPTTTHWQHQSEELQDSFYAYELRLFCISRSSWQVLWYADTRRAYYECSFRFFLSTKWGRGIEIDMDAALDADGLGCQFNHVDLTGIREIMA